MIQQKAITTIHMGELIHLSVT